MNLDDAIVLETFPNRIAAELAAGLLESEGVEAMVAADDASGAFPPLQFIRGVRLLVYREDEARAREILQAMEAPADPESRRMWPQALACAYISQGFVGANFYQIKCLITGIPKGRLQKNGISRYWDRDKKVVNLIC